jgi:hypothetical protein
VNVLTFGDLDFVSQVTCFTIDLDVVMQELFKSSGVKDLISRRPRVIDDEFVLGSNLSAFPDGRLGLFCGRFGLLCKWN